MKARRKAELDELTALTCKDIDNWQDMADAKNDEEDVKEAQYATLLQQAKEEKQEGNRSIAGIVLLSVSMLGTAVFMRSKGII